jgi:hypothetical protein
MLSAEMSGDVDIIRCGGNVFRDLGHPGADGKQSRALLAAKIVGVPDDRKLAVRAAHEVTGVAAAVAGHGEYLIRASNLGFYVTTSE